MVVYVFLNIFFLSFKNVYIICMLFFFKGETGLLVSRITRFAPFSGYARNNQQTEKKVLRDVFEKGDAYFNTGDLLRSDHDNFIYFQDRVGDTYRYFLISQQQHYTSVFLQITSVGS